MATTDINRSSFVLAPFGVVQAIDLGGDNLAVSFLPDPKVVSTPGINGPQFSVIRTPKAVITITAFASDPIHATLRRIYNQQSLPGFFMTGSVANHAGEIASFNEAWITQAAALDLEEQASTKTWVIEVGQHSIAQVPTL